MWASTFAYMRLRRGLPLTFEIRKQCALETFKCLSIYACYLSVMMFFFAIISSLDPNPPIGSSLSNFSLFLLFIIANRGSVDGIVWFMLHDFQRDVISMKKNDNDNNNGINISNSNNFYERNLTYIKSIFKKKTTTIDIDQYNDTPKYVQNIDHEKNIENGNYENGENGEYGNGEYGNTDREDSENLENVPRSRRNSIFLAPLAGMTET